MGVDLSKLLKFAPGALRAEAALEKLVTERILSGYASTWEPPERADSHGEIIIRGAFLDSIARHDSGEFVIKMRDEHGNIVGVWRELREDDKGLWVSGYISKIPEGDHLITKISDGAVDSLSIGGRVELAAWLEGTESYGRWGMEVRELRKIWLREISPTGTPANIYAKIEDLKMARADDYRAWCATHRRAPQPDAPTHADLHSLAQRADRVADGYRSLNEALRSL